MVNPKDVNDYFCYGEGLIDFGFVVGYAINGPGLVTRGLVWQAPEIWGPATGYSSLSTSWALISGWSTLSTSWAAPTGYSALLTGWTTAQFGIYSELPPKF